jgi:hypothetical protein
MLRSVFAVAGCVMDVTLALNHAVAPEATLWISGLSLVAAGAGCVLMARSMSRKLAGLDLPTVRRV